MTRRIVSRAPRGSLAGFLGTPKPKRKVNPGSRRKQHIAEIRQRVEAKDWTDVSAGKLVALYWFCHETVYGVEPTELDSAATWRAAMLQSGRMVRDNFDSDVQRAIRFMQWVWSEEQRRETWRRNNDKNGKRINWRMQFIFGDLVTDYRAAQSRKQGLM